MNNELHLLSHVEVDRVEVHVVGGSGESQTRHRVEQVSGKVCAIIVTVDPPANRKLSPSHGLKCLKKSKGSKIR